MFGLRKVYTLSLDFDAPIHLLSISLPVITLGVQGTPKALVMYSGYDGLIHTGNISGAPIK